MAFSVFFKSLLGCLCELDADVLLNNISEFHPNLALIKKWEIELYVNATINQVLLTRQKLAFSMLTFGF
jgi:hypothetical protein